MQGRHSALHIALDDATRLTLQGWLRNQQPPVALATRARAILLLADGQTFAATARHLELRERHVRKWALRLVASGIDGLYDKIAEALERAYVLFLTNCMARLWFSQGRTVKRTS